MLNVVCVCVRKKSSAHRKKLFPPEVFLASTNTYLFNDTHDPAGVISEYFIGQKVISIDVAETFEEFSCIRMRVEQVKKGQHPDVVDFPIQEDPSLFQNCGESNEKNKQVSLGEKVF